MSKQPDNGSAFDVLQEVYALARDIDKNFGSIKLEVSELKALIAKNETKSDSKAIELHGKIQELEEAFQSWHKIWGTNKKYVYFSLALSTIGASATLGFEFVIEIIKKFLGLK